MRSRGATTPWGDQDRQERGSPTLSLESYSELPLAGSPCPGGLPHHIRLEQQGLGEPKRKGRLLLPRNGTPSQEVTPPQHTRATCEKRASPPWLRKGDAPLQLNL